jgi:hypothetical protein
MLQRKERHKRASSKTHDRKHQLFHAVHEKRIHCTRNNPNGTYDCLAPAPDPRAVVARHGPYRHSVNGNESLSGLPKSIHTQTKSFCLPNMIITMTTWWIKCSLDALVLKHPKHRSAVFCCLQPAKANESVYVLRFSKNGTIRRHASIVEKDNEKQKQKNKHKIQYPSYAPSTCHPCWSNVRSLFERPRSVDRIQRSAPLNLDPT